MILILLWFQIPASFWSLDPTIRHTIWSTSIGAAFMWMMIMASNQSVTQRVMCLSTTKKAIATVNSVNSIDGIISCHLFCHSLFLAISLNQYLPHTRNKLVLVDRPIQPCNQPTNRWENRPTHRPTYLLIELLCCD